MIRSNNIHLITTLAVYVFLKNRVKILMTFEIIVNLSLKLSERKS